jgi:hypothetical protein
MSRAGILFDVGKTSIKDQFHSDILLEAVMELNDNENAFIVSLMAIPIAIGGDRINDPLSFRRANAVKKYLVQTWVQIRR